MASLARNVPKRFEMLSARSSAPAPGLSGEEVLTVLRCGALRRGAVAPTEIGPPISATDRLPRSEDRARPGSRDKRRASASG